MFDLPKLHTSILVRQSLTAFLCLNLASLASGPAFAQDPFGASSSDPFATNAKDDSSMTPPTVAVVPAGASAVAEDPDPLVRMLRTTPPKTATDFAESLEWMARIGRWDEVGRYLDILQKSGWNREQLGELSSAGGANLWFRLRDSGKALSESQQKFVRELSAIPAQLARDPNWIDAWIDRLASPNAGDRREAQMRLHRAHRAGIERLCARLLNGDQRVSGARLIEAILQFDDDGLEALRAACVAKDSAARARVLLALSQTSTTEFSVELSSAVESTLLSVEERQAISDSLLKKYSQLPTSSTVRDFMLSRFKRQLDDYQLMRSHPARVPVTVWRTTVDGQRVSVVEASPADRSLELLAQVAAHRIAYSVRTHDDLVDCATVLLQHSYQAQPGVETGAPVGGLLGWLPEEANGSDFWKQVLDRSETWQMHGAAIRASQAIGRELSNSLPGSAAFDFMASCLRDSRPVIRYCAVEAIARANPQTAYNGSAIALETAIEMSRMKTGPMVLVVGLTSDLRQAADQQLVAVGAQSISVNSTQAALLVLDQPNPIEMIMVVDRVANHSVRALVERLRHSRRGKSLPVAVLTDQLESYELTELSRVPGVVLSVLSEDKEHMPRVIAELDRRLDVRPLSASERSVFIETANSLLSKIGTDRKQYGFYPLARWDKELRSAVDSLPTNSWIAIVGALGTADSQEQLMAVASDSSAAEATRAQSAAAFSESVKQFGLLIANESQMKAYDLYNIQGPRDAVTVSALGQVLDAIESKTSRAQAAPTP
jgi:hypothetical protein